MTRAAALGAALLVGGCQIIFAPASSGDAPSDGGDAAGAGDACARPSGAALFEDFEGARLWEEWAEPPDSVTISEAEDRCGQFALATEDGAGDQRQAAAAFSFAETSVIGARAQFFLPEEFPGGADVALLTIALDNTTGGAPLVGVARASSGLLNVFIEDGPSIVLNRPVETGNWYQLELLIEDGSAARQIRLLVEGDEVLSAQAAELEAAPAIRALFGIHWSRLSAPAEVYVDNVALFY